jgi:hypothetical protein
MHTGKWSAESNIFSISVSVNI